MRPWTSEGVGCGILSIFVGMGMAVCQFSSLWYCGDGPRAIPKRNVRSARSIGLIEMLRRHRAAAKAVLMLKVRLSASGLRLRLTPQPKS